jgi:hypothetical protein
MTTVISLRGHRDDPEFDPALNSDVTYCGNRQWWGRGRLLDGHPLANPFRVKKHGRDEALRLYREWLPTVPNLEGLLEELRGKTLACWCKEPDRWVACHCDEIAEAIAKRWGPS